MRLTSSAHPDGDDTLTLTVENVGADGGRPVCVVRAVGEIDMVTAPLLRTALAAAFADAGVVVVDLCAVNFLGSSGLAVLVESREIAVREQRELRVATNSRIVNRALEVTGLHTVLEISADVPSALAV